MAGTVCILMLVWSLWLMGTVLLATVQGVILCQCTTEECQAEGKDTCTAAHFCYSELFKDTLSRGCIDEGSSLLCENRRPKGIDHWPSLFCCNDHSLCNKDVAPTFPTGPEETKATAEEPQQPAEVHPPDLHDAPVLCQDAVQHPDDAQRSSSSRGRVINPIYIAVPVAGVCVLLALVIFAMYLLRRRHHHYDNYHYYHDHLPPPPRGRKLPGASPGLGRVGGRGGGVPLYPHHHHCECMCQQSLPPCSGGEKMNRCTDSERSSSGSETKLFLQA